MHDHTDTILTPKAVLNEITLRLDNCSTALADAGETMSFSSRVLVHLTKRESGLRGLLSTMEGESNPLVLSALLHTALQIRNEVERLETTIVANLSDEYNDTISSWEA